MTRALRDEPRIGPPSPADRQTALDLVLADLEPFDRTRVSTQALALAGQGGLDGLLAAGRGERLAGAIWLQIQPGGYAALWPPRLAPGEPDALAGALIEAALEPLAAQGVSIVQALLTTDAGPDAQRLTAAGFRWVADLLYLVSQLDDVPLSPPAGPLVFEPAVAFDDPRLATLVQATYRDTLDCPLVSGLRPIADVMEGYHGSGGFDPARWLIARHLGQDVGCLILADHPDVGHWELVYMGLVPESRGRGLGLEIVRHAQWLARCAGAGRLVLAVDAANSPAIRLYVAAGFSAWDRRSAFLCVLPPARPPPTALP